MTKEGSAISGDLERRYRRVLRLLPAYYREQWEEDMVAAFLESSLTGDFGEDILIAEFGWPSWLEVASILGLAARLYLGGGADAPRRYFAWGQAIRGAVLTVTLVQAARGLNQALLIAWSRRLFGWLPAPPSSLVVRQTGGALPPDVQYLIACAWIVAFVMLVFRHYRIAQVMAALAIVPDLVWLLRGEFFGFLPAVSVGPWAFWILLNLAPVLAMTAFHRDAPPARAGLGCWGCPLPTSWYMCRCWWLWRLATKLGCRTFPGCTASWSPLRAWRTLRGHGPAPPTRACGR